MRRACCTLFAASTALLLFLTGAGASANGLAGRYELAEGPDAAGMLELGADGRFAYALSVGALDEQARGRWEPRGARACLTTEPSPRPPEFVRAAARPDQNATVLVETAQGQGIPGIDVKVGFDEGEPATGYTQYDGWSLPAGETRTPRWVELSEPIHRFASARMPLAPADAVRLRAVIVPNDLGTPDFRDACLEKADGHFVLHRAEGQMRFRRADR